MWVWVWESDVLDGQVHPVPVGGLLADEGVYAVAWGTEPTREEDGVVPIPGRDPRRTGCATAWVTGVVTALVEDGSDRGHIGQRGLLVAGGTPLICRTWRRRREQLRWGDRVTLPCSFELVAGSDWSLVELPDGASADWRVREALRLEGPTGVLDHLLDLEPVSR
ncbi:hypothetical protein ACFFOM_09445 [Microlunatus capsulatus]|uniref:Uncharacterized protein n=1 Tax=Microlunatus capsulatus TaxID=99117 RepID=A0ABS4ZAG4_9ACTN|nr:hypothetical protein [Microlunatus capsulatus]MBP2418042.1 hypothetical protein [Microlunatus capsulatus]